VTLHLEEIDVLIINHLQDDRKSFRQISSETCITPPAVKLRFKRLVSVGLIQEVVLLFDYGNVDACHQENIIHIKSFKHSSEKNYNNILEGDVSTIEEN
jgi:DNA-binding Lrp family transcriptional regulator